MLAIAVGVFLVLFTQKKTHLNGSNVNTLWIVYNFLKHSNVDKEYSISIEKWERDFAHETLSKFIFRSFYDALWFL